MQEHSALRGALPTCDIWHVKYCLLPEGIERQSLPNIWTNSTTRRIQCSIVSMPTKTQELKQCIWDMS